VIKNWASRLSITWKIVLASLVGIALFLAGFLAVFLPQIEEMVLSERRLFLKERTDIVLGLFQQYQADIDAGSLDLAEAQRRATRRIKGMSLDKNEYFWIMDTGRPFPRVIAHPGDPTLEGEVFNPARPGTASTVRLSPSGDPLRIVAANPVVAMVDVCLEHGEGYVAYTWPKPRVGGVSPAGIFPKESYVVLFKPWGWIIGTGQYMDDLEQLVGQLRTAAFLFLGFVTLLAVLVAALMAATITRPLRRIMTATASIAQGDLNVHSGLEGTSDELENLSKSFDNMAYQLRQREQERKAADTARRDSERKMRAVFHNSFQLIWLLTPEGVLLECNQSALDYIEGKGDSPLGKHFWDTAWWTGDPAMVFRLHAALDAARDGDFMRFETTFAHPRLGQRVIDFSIKTARDASGAVALIIPEGRDITEIRAMEGRLAHMGMHDPLTGLANRTLLTDRVRHAMQVARRKPGTRQALLYIDINRFKIINDSLGHLAGDAILRDVASRIQRCVRETDTVARYGGDDFVVLLWELASYREAISIARRIRADLSTPLGQADNPISIRVSIGIDLLMNPRNEPEDAVRNAHLAMSHSKARGRGFLKVYTPHLLQQVRTSLAIESEMERGIRTGEFFLRFQPILDTKGGQRLAGFEALCRWSHPERGLILPAEFIPVAEATGLIVPLGRWVLDAACSTLAEFSRLRPECPDVYVAVNLSPLQLERADLVQTVRDAVERHGLDAPRLHLEVTETSLMSGNATMMENILKLKRLGVRMVVDDFGTGYSNLALLTRIHFAVIKIDRSLVWQIQHVLENRTIIKAIVTMAENLGADVIVEGIETTSQRDILKTIGCHVHQGFLYSRPVDLPALAGMRC